jgi:hypothetical protein
VAQFSEKPTLLDCGHCSDVRPLAIGITGEIAAVMGWSHLYTLGVLAGWKMAAVYCQAVICYDQRVALDGAPAEVVDAKAKGPGSQAAGETCGT